ncbi:MAG: type II toxin-antitoxin system VapC family toxin [Saprospiraceae bacterium]|nr:type II toxin-antitoxin system VapC family toxin [Lewinella sp.]
MSDNFGPTVVLDASAALEVVLVREKAKMLSVFVEQADQIFAPELLLLECGNALGKYIIFGGLSQKQAEERLRDIPLFITDWEKLPAIYEAAFRLAVDQKISIYDACYLVIAIRQKGMLLSLDKKLNRVAAEMDISILH